MPKFDVFFEQINQTAIEVDAKDHEEAITKAKKEWKAMYAEPCAKAVQPVK